MAKLNASKFTNRDILVTGVDPSTGEYLSAAQRKALFRKKKISSNQVFRKPGALVKVGSSAITPDVDVNVLNVRVVAVEKQVSFLAKVLDKEAELEKKGQKEREKELLQQEEKQLRSGKEKQLEKGLSKSLLAPVKGVGRAAKGILGNLMELFGVLFAGWLTDKGWKAIAANATGDIGTLEEIKKNVIDALLKVGGIFLAINGGLFVALKLLKKITKKIGGFVWRNTFGKLFSALNPFKKPNAAANAAGAAASAGVDAATTKPKPKPTVDADDLTDAQKLAKKKLAQEVVDRGLSAKGAMVGGKYLSVDAAEAAELLKPKKVGFFQRIKNVAGNIGSGISSLAKKGAGAIKAGFSKLVGPIIAPFLNKAKSLGNKVLSTIQKLPGYSKIASFLQKEGLGTVKNVAGGGKKLGAKALPVIGGIANLLFAYDRLANGDSIGAALETISAILDFSGAGWPLSLGLDAFLFARDFVPGIKGGEDALLGKLGLTGMVETLNTLGGKLPNLGELVGPLFGKKPEQPEPTKELTSEQVAYKKWLDGRPDEFENQLEWETMKQNGKAPGFSPPSGPAPKPPTAPSIASPASPQMQAPGPVTSSGNTTVIYKKVGGGGQSQQQSMKSGSATDVPLISSSNPDNFYTMYSQLIYNVVN